MRAPLRHAAFTRLAAAQTASMLGDGVFAVALAFAVLEATGSAASLAIILGVAAVLQAGTSLVAGVWADRLPRIHLMLGADGARVVVQTLLAVLLFTDTATLWTMLPLVCLYWIATAMFQPAVTGIVPQILPSNLLLDGNAVLKTVRSVTTIAGNALGGILVAAFGAGIAFLLDAATFLVSAAFLIGLRDVPRAARTLPTKSMLAEIGEGFAAVRERRWLWVVILNSFVYLAVFLAPLLVVGPQIAQSDLGGAATWGIVLALMTAGTALGAWIASRRVFRQPITASIVLLLPATVLVNAALAFTWPTLAIAAAFALLGTSYGLFDTVWHAVQQERIPEDVLGRVSSIDWMGALSGLPIGFLIAAVFLAAGSTLPLLILMTVGGVGCCVWLLVDGDVREIGVERDTA